MEEFVPFASRSYGLMFLLLFVSRGMDFLSTWVATPNMVLERKFQRLLSPKSP